MWFIREYLEQWSNSKAALHLNFAQIKDQLASSQLVVVEDDGLITYTATETATQDQPLKEPGCTSTTEEIKDKLVSQNKTGFLFKAIFVKNGVG